MDGEPENITPGIKSSHCASAEKERKSWNLFQAHHCVWGKFVAAQIKQQPAVSVNDIHTDGMSEQDTLAFKDVFNTNFNDIVAGPPCLWSTAASWRLHLNFQISLGNDPPYPIILQFKWVISVIFIVFILNRLTILSSFVINYNFLEHPTKGDCWKLVVEDAMCSWWYNWMRMQLLYCGVVGSEVWARVSNFSRCPFVKVLTDCQPSPPPPPSWAGCVHTGG